MSRPNHVNHKDLKSYFNEVQGITAVCRSNKDWIFGEHPELEAGKTYEVTHFSVLRSSSSVVLKDFPGREYNCVCFDFYEDGVSMGGSYVHDIRFFSPHLRMWYQMMNRQYYASYMEEKDIPRFLRLVENKHDIRILLAVELGSRVYGYDSLDSDWDVRFIYTSNEDGRGEPCREHAMIKHVYAEVDMIGWSAADALNLLKDGAPVISELIGSPKVYLSDAAFEKRFRKKAEELFDPQTVFNQYRLTCIESNECRIGNNEDVKYFIHYLRGILACEWLATRGTRPPVKLEELIDGLLEGDSLKEIRAAAHGLLEMQRGGEKHKIKVIDPILREYAARLSSQLPERFI